MADANVDSTQQAQDAQTLDNLTSLQQADTGATAPTGGTADATVTTSNPPAPDTPSLYNETTGTYNNQANLEAAGTNSLLDTTTFTNDGRTGAANESPTIGSGVTFGTEVNAGETQLQYTVTNENPTIQGSGTNGTQNTVGGAQGAAGAAETTVTTEAAATTTAETTTAPTADAPTTNSTPAPTLNPDGTSPADPTVDPLVIDPTPQEPVAALVTTTVTLNDVAVNEAGTIIYTASVNNPPASIFTVTLSNGVVITFAPGSLLGFSEPQPPQGNDPYLDAERFQVSIQSTLGGNFENLITTDTATVTVEDTIDTTTVSLTAAPDFTEDGTSLTYTVTLGAEVRAGDAPVVVTFKDLNGATQTITITSGNTGTTTTPIVISEATYEDVYKEAAADLPVATEVSVAQTGTGGKFELLGTANIGTVALTDTIDTTTVSLTAAPDFTEDGTSLTYTVTLGAEVRAGDAPVVVTFKDLNGATQTITITSGNTGTTTTPIVISEATYEDVYKEAAADLPVATEVSVAQTGTGGKFELLGTANIGTVALTDTIDTTTVSLTAAPDFTEDGTSLTYTVTLGAEVRAGDAPVVVTFKDLNGATQTITITSGNTGTTTTPIVISEATYEDVYKEAAADLPVATEVSVAQTGTGGKFELLGTANIGTVALTDTIDTTTVSLTAAPDFTEDGTSLTYTVTLGAEVRAGDAPVVVTFKDLNGATQTITITSGNTGTTTTPIVISEATYEDVYKEAAADLPVATEVSVAQTGTGGKFELLGTANIGTVALTDTIDTTTVSLTAAPDFTEDGTSLTYTVTLGAEVRAGDAPVVVTFKDLNGATQTITITSGNTGTTTTPIVISEATYEDVYKEAAADLPVATEVSVAQTGTGGKFELLGTANIGTVALTDTIDTTTVSLTAAPDFTEDGTSLTYTVTLGAEVRAGDAPVVVTFKDLNGATQTITITSGNTGTTTTPIVISEATYEDVYKEAAADLPVATEVSVAQTGTGGKFELLGTANIGTVALTDTIDTTTVSLTAAPDFTEDGTSLTYTVTLGAEVRAGDAPVVVTFKDLNGATQTITITSGNTGTTTTPIVISEATYEDVYKEAAADLPVATEVSVAQTGTGGKFELLGTANIGTVALTDTIDTTTVSLTAAPDFTEDGTSLTYTVTLGAEVRAGDAPVVVTFKDLNGATQTITITSGNTGTTTTPIVISEATYEDVYKEAAADLPVATEVSVAQTGTGGKFELLGTANIGTVALTDTIDTTTVSLTAAPDFTEDGTSLTYTVTLGAEVRAGDAPVVVTFKDLNGATQTITITSGNTGTTTTPIVISEATYEDVYKEAAADLPVATEVSVAQTGTGGKFELLGTANIGTVALTDTIDTTTVSLTAAPDFTEDGTSLTYTVTLGAEVRAGDAPVVVTFKDLNGATQTITITSGNTGTTTTPIVISEATYEDVYKEAAADLPVATEVSVAQTGTGGKFELLGTANIGTVALTDTIDTTTVSLTAAPDFTEDGTSLTYTVTLGAEVRAGDAPVVVTFKDLNGATQTITITSGNTGTTTTPIVISEATYEDVYKEAAADLPVATEVSVAQTGTGGKFELLGTANIGTVALTDTIDTTTVSLTAAPDFTEDGTSLTYTVTLGAEVRAGDAPVVVTFKDLNGATQTITITSGNTGTTTTPIVISEATYEDVYKEAAADLPVATEVSVAQTGTGGKFELLGTANIGTVALTDTIDTTTVSLTAAPDFTEDGTSLTYTVTLGAEVRAGDAPVVVTFKDLNGATQTITITSGNTGTTTTPIVISEATYEDVYKEAAADLPVATEVSVAQTGTGGKFELLGTANIGTVALTDTIDTTTVSLTAAPDFTEDGTSLTYTVTLGAEVRAGDAPVVVTFKDLNGATQTITITSGNTGTTTTPIVISEATYEDVYKEAAADLPVATEVSVAQTGTGGKFELLGTANIGTVALTDTIDTTTVSLTAAPDFTEDGTSLTYTVTLGAEVRAGDAPVVVTFKDLNGATQTITITSGNTGTTTTPIVISEATYEDVYKEAAADLPVATEVSVAQTGTGGKFELLGTANIGTVALTDTIDTTTVSLTADNVYETESAIRFTAELSNPGETAVTITLDINNANGDPYTITIAAGESNGFVDVSISEDDDYVEGTESLTATITNVTGGNFEDIDYSTDGIATAYIFDIGTPSISIIKSSKLVSDIGMDGKISDVREDVEYSISIQNTGEVDLTDVVVTDQMFGRLYRAYEIAFSSDSSDASINTLRTVTGSDGNKYLVNKSGDDVDPIYFITIGDLNSGAGPVKLTYVIDLTQDDINLGGNYDSADSDSIFDQLRNTATVSSAQTSAVIAENILNVIRTPELTVTKSAKVSDTNSADFGGDRSAGTFLGGKDGSVDSAGDVITYTIKVENTGNTTLTDVGVYDSMFKSSTLGLGAIYLYASQADIAISNPIRELSADANGKVVVDGSLDLGEDYFIVYTYTVQASDIDDNLDAEGGVAGNDLDESLLGKVDILNFVDNVAQGYSGEDNSIVAYSLVSISTPELTVTKSAKVSDTNSADFGGDRSAGTFLGGKDGSVDSAGDVITYTIKVENTGNTTLTDVGVYDSMFKSSTLGLGAIYLYASQADIAISNPIRELSADANGKVVVDGSLDLGEDYFIVYTYTVQASDIATFGGGDFDIDNEFSAHSAELNVPIANYSINIESFSDVGITKKANVTSVAGIGDTVEYTLLIKNEGTTNLHNIYVKDLLLDNAVDLDANSNNGIQVKVEYWEVDQHGKSQQLSGENYPATVNVAYLGLEPIVNIGALGLNQYAIVTYDYIVSGLDYPEPINTVRSIFDYESKKGPVGIAGDPIEFSYGSFVAYVNADNSDPYSLTEDDPARVFINVDNTGMAVGVNAGVMSGDRNGNSDHLKATFLASDLNGGKSLVEAASIIFTNAKDVELGFNVQVGSSGKDFNGSIIISESGDVILREVQDGVAVTVKGKTSVVHGLTGSSSNLDLSSTYKFIPGAGTSFENGWSFTLSEMPGPGGAQNKIYTLTFDAGDDTVSSFDFYVVGNADDNAVEQIKVVDVQFDVLDFGAVDLVNTATVYSDEDGKNNIDGQSDEISTAVVNLLTDLTVEDALIAQSLGEKVISIKDTAKNFSKISGNTDLIQQLNNIKVVTSEGKEDNSSLGSEFDGILKNPIEATISVAPTNGYLNSGSKVTVQFSKLPPMDFSNYLIAQGGTLGEFNALSENKYEAVFIASSGVQSAENHIYFSSSFVKLHGIAASSQSYSIDSIAPTIASGQTAIYAENQVSTSVVLYKVEAQDSVGITAFRLDSASVSDGYAINSAGEITLTSLTSAVNDFEVGNMAHTLLVEAQDAAGNWSLAKQITLNEANIDEVKPTVDSLSTGAALENQNILYTATATDTDFNTAGVTWSLTGTDAGLLNISNAGVVTLKTGNLDYESSKKSYNFNVVATDLSGNASDAKAVTVTVSNIDEVKPTVDSLSTGAALENQNILYTATATDTDFNTAGVTWSLTGTDAGLLNISNAGVVTLKTGNLDYESSKKSYNFNVVATDLSGNASDAKAVTVNVTDVFDTPVKVTGLSAFSLTSSTPKTVVLTFSQAIDPSSFDPTTDLSVTLAGGVTQSNIGWNSLNTQYTIQFSTSSASAKNVTVALSPSSTVTVSGTEVSLVSAPIAFDLNGNGVTYLSQETGTVYDFNHDGISESTAWVAPEDGLLAVQKDDGTHNIVFSTQAGETDLQGLAKVYDSNKDGVLDKSDADFAKFGVWQDADSDGIVDNGEFLSLADRGITSLSLTSDGQVHFEANGDVIVYGQTTYTTSDGQLHIAEDVGFAVSDVYEPLDIATIIANADAIESVTRIDQSADTESSSSLMVELGGQTYEIATLAGHEAGTEDILSQFVGSDTSANLLTNKSWTDVIDISSDHGGPGSIIAAGGTLNEGNYANGEGDWTVIINSGDAKVDASNNQITFASESADNSVTIITADGASHDINNVDKIQWHG